LDLKFEFKWTTKPNLLLLIVSAVLFITIFLPWWSWSGVGVGIYAVPGWSVNGFHNGGVLTFLMSLAGIAFAFLSVQRTRAILSIAAGILSFLGAIISVASLSGAGVGFGLIIAIIVSLGLATVGYLDYRNINPLASKTAKPPQAQVPPAQPPSPPPAAPPPPPPPPAPPKQ
jgi:hypothetical protein